jgi:hypothetical protein
MKLEELRTYALSLPATSEEPHFNYGSFRVKGKIFVTLPPGGELAHVFVAEELRDKALALYPAAIEPLTWGKKVVGVRVSLQKAKAEFVRELVRGAWMHKAPKALLKANAAAV